jgi:hypothetical protein
MRKKAYKLSDLFDGVSKDKEVMNVCSMKDYVKVLRRQMADLQELIDIVEEHGSDLYIPAMDVLREVEHVRKSIAMSSAQRFQRMVVHAHDVVELYAHHSEKQAKEVKLTTDGEDIIASQKPTTEPVDRLALSMACTYKESFSRLIDKD